MTEVWKSVPKKFCEICKCWFYDNKVSIQHHEQGGRHQENVKKKLRDIGKKSRDRDNEDRATQIALAQMERGALAAYKRDAKDSVQSAIAYNVHLNLEGLPVGGASSASKKQRIIADNEAIMRAIASSSAPVWYEVRAPVKDGGSVVPYYWNIQTGETLWELPKGVTCVPWSDQQAQTSMTANSSTAFTTGITTKDSSTSLIPVEEGASSSGSADGLREDRKRKEEVEKKAVSEDDGDSNLAGASVSKPDIVARLIKTAVKLQPSAPSAVVKEVPVDDPEYKNPYGEWQPVEVEKSRKDEFAYLPHNQWAKEEETVTEELPPDDEDVMKIKFGERTAPSLGGAHAGGPCAFKRRRTGRTAKKADDE